MASYVLTCYDDPPPANGAVCTNGSWDVAPTFLPPLDVQGAADIGAAILLLFAIAWVFKLLRHIL